MSLCLLKPVRSPAVGERVTFALRQKRGGGVTVVKVHLMS